MGALPPIIELSGITKAYGATIANSNVSFSAAPGQVHALLGENGAGKSTTMKILSGLVRPDSGTIRLNGQEIRFRSAIEAQLAGIQTAFQELTLIPDLTILDNMLIPKGETNPLGLLKRGEAVRAVAAHLDELDLDIDIHALAGDLSLANKQKIEIARALLRRPNVLLLDEPTSALSGRDVDWLGDIIERSKAAGVTVIFISHRLPEVRAFCDTLSILRNGEHIRSGFIDDFSDDEVVELIIGRSVETAFPPREDVEKRDLPNPVLSVRSMCAGPKLKDVDFDLHPGEILGIAGLQGMGQRELFMSLFGAEPIDSGQMLVDGKPVQLTSPADALHPSIGIGLVPEERKTQGLFLKMSGLENAALPVLNQLCKGPLIDGDKEREEAASAFEAVEVDERAHYLAAGAFSGGNQQKISIAKWLVANSRILLLFDPTRGIDVGTKHQLYELMRSYAEKGGAILLYSTEIPELVHLSDRLGVIYEGEITTWLEGANITENKVLDATLGGVSSDLSKVAAEGCAA
ncbi:MAG: sugar ABC transporter ATP-binding protein [Phyllobacteriaceae bacterium]|jgi:ribose transport system ATP-binding protein|nr:sugar ABC transporter ATP-binding protein [Phyllobacteriaceae bacterium]